MTCIFIYTAYTKSVFFLYLCSFVLFFLVETSLLHGRMQERHPKEKKTYFDSVVCFIFLCFCLFQGRFIFIPTFGLDIFSLSVRFSLYQYFNILVEL